MKTEDKRIKREEEKRKIQELEEESQRKNNERLFKQVLFINNGKELILCNLGIRKT